MTPIVQNDRVLDLKTVEAVLSRIHPDSPVLPAQGQSGAAERFRLLSHRLRRARAQKALRTVLVTSSIPAEGKSTIALNLAAVLASGGASTLLVEADLRVPALHKTLGLTSMPGLSNILTGEAVFAPCVRRVDPMGFYFLQAGASVPNPLPLLESPAFKDVLARARAAFEWVVIDSPPLNPIADAHCVATDVDGILLVVRWGFTPKEQLKQAIDNLRGLPLLGSVINDFDEPQEPYYYSYNIRSEALPVLPPAAGEDRPLY